MFTTIFIVNKTGAPLPTIPVCWFKRHHWPEYKQDSYVAYVPDEYVVAAHLAIMQAYASMPTLLYFRLG